MEISNFISTVWSEVLLKSLNKKYIGVTNCTRFEGDIRHRGDRVKICVVGRIDIFDYTKNTDFDDGVQTIDDTEKTIVIDQAKEFNFQIDGIDRAQSNPKLMDAAVHVAAESLADIADAYVYSLYEDAGETVEDSAPADSTMFNDFIKAIRILMEHNVTRFSDIVLEVSPAVAELILQAKLVYNDTNASVETGCIGTMLGCPLYVSNNVAKVENEDDSTVDHMCFARTRRAIAFAERISEIDAYRPEKRFADAVKGLHLYGATVVYPDELVVVKVSLHADDQK